MNSNANFLALLALGIADERTREAENERLARSFSAGRPGLLRRGLARLAAFVSRVAADVARRLDNHVLDTDLPTHPSAA
jgi:hypothetical protein